MTAPYPGISREALCCSADLSTRLISKVAGKSSLDPRVRINSEGWPTMLQAHNDKALSHRKLIINCCVVLLGMSEIFRVSDYRSVPTLSRILTEFRTDVDKVSRVDAWVLALFSLEQSALWMRIRLIHKLVLFDINLCVPCNVKLSVTQRRWLTEHIVCWHVWEWQWGSFEQSCMIAISPFVPCVFLCIFHCHCISDIIYILFYCLLIFVVLQVWRHD